MQVGLAALWMVSLVRLGPASDVDKAKTQITVETDRTLREEFG